MSVNDVDPAAVDPREFARLVKDASSGELKQLMHSAARTPVLDKIFHDMPGVFRGDRAGALAAVIHWKVGDRPDGGVDTYELIIEDGVCVCSAAPEREPRLQMSIGGVDFLRMVTGNANPVSLFMRGRLRAKGDVGLAMKVPNLFEPPRA